MSRFQHSGFPGQLYRRAIETNGYFQTSDGTLYQRRDNGVIVRLSPKLSAFRTLMKGKLKRA